MSRSESNLSNISNNDLVLLRKGAKKHSKVSISAGNKKFQIEGTNLSILTTKDGFAFLSMPATNAIYRNGALVTAPEEVKVAVKALKQAGRSAGASKRKSSDPELPEELRKQLEAFSKQNNSRVIFDPSSPNGYKVQKLRTRKPKK